MNDVKNVLGSAFDSRATSTQEELSYQKLLTHLALATLMFIPAICFSVAGSTIAAVSYVFIPLGVVSSVFSAILFSLVVAVIAIASLAIGYFGGGILSLVAESVENALKKEASRSDQVKAIMLVALTIIVAAALCYGMVMSFSFLITLIPVTLISSFPVLAVAYPSGFVSIACLIVGYVNGYKLK
jgi:hypothetical protein